MASSSESTDGAAVPMEGDIAAVNTPKIKKAATAAGGKRVMHSPRGRSPAPRQRGPPGSVGSRKQADPDRGRPVPVCPPQPGMSSRPVSGLMGSACVASTDIDRLPAIRRRAGLQWRVDRCHPFTVAGAAPEWNPKGSHRLPVSLRHRQDAPADTEHLDERTMHGGLRFCKCIRGLRP